MYAGFDDPATSYSTVTSLKRCLAKFENIEDHLCTNIFVTSFDKFPMDDTSEVTILKCTGLGYMPQEPLALLAKLSDSEKGSFRSREGEIVGPVVTETTPYILSITFIAALIDISSVTLSLLPTVHRMR